MKIYLIRHCDTIEGKNGIILGHLDGNLSQKGISEAKKIGEFLKNSHFGIEKILTSNLKRAIDTSKIINNYLHLEIKELKNISVDGVYSNLSASSSDIDFSKLQIKQFQDILNILKNENINYNYSHIFNSGAIFNFKEYDFNMVRIGLLIYGYYPNEKFKKLLKLYPSMTLKTNINFIKEIDINETVGYNKNFIAKRKSTIATIPFGFGDGFIGLEAGKPYNPYVIVNKKNPLLSEYVWIIGG